MVDDQVHFTEGIEQIICIFSSLWKIYIKINWMMDYYCLESTNSATGMFFKHTFFNV